MQQNQNLTYTKVTFEDKGQDFLTFLIEFYPDYQYGTVVAVDPAFQYSVWVGQIVLSGKPAKGKYLAVSKSPKDAVTTIKYKMEKVEHGIELELYHLTRYDPQEYGYIEAAIVAATDQEDALVVLRSDNNSRFAELADSPETVIHHVGTANNKQRRGVITSSTCAE